MKSTILALLLVVSSVEAQTSWVVCKSMTTGVEDVFEHDCPSGWYFVRWA